MAVHGIERPLGAAASCHESFLFQSPSAAGGMFPNIPSSPHSPTAAADETQPHISVNTGKITVLMIHSVGSELNLSMEINTSFYDLKKKNLKLEMCQQCGAHFYVY